MTESVLHQQEIRSPEKWIRSLVWKIGIGTLLLMAIGSATRVMNAGLACPDWPLCYGQLIPSQQMNFQVFLEWFHRLDASLIGLSTIGLVSLSWWWRRDLPLWLPWASLFALFLVIFQGILGGLTVTEMLRFDIVTAHLGTALLFFSTLVAIGAMLTPYKAKTPRHLSWVGLTAAILVYGQSLVGGLVASRWALHQCLGGAGLCTVMNSHLFGVLPPTVATLTLFFLARRKAVGHSILRQLANLAAGLVLWQILLGIATFRFHLQIELLTVSHQTVGAVLLGTLVAFTVLANRSKNPGIH